MRFYEKLELYSNQLAVIDSFYNSYTYSDLNQECENWIQGLNRSRKQLIFILSNNNMETLVGYLSALKAGHTAFLINNDIDEKNLFKLINLYHPDFIWSSEYKNKKNIIYSYKNYKLFENNSKKNKTINPNLALLLSTSGSTGSSKLVRLSYNNIDSNAKAIANYLEISNIDKPITTLPFYYSYGLSVINSHLEMGSTILLNEFSLMQREFWNFLKEKEASSLAGVPYTFEMLKFLRFFKMDLPHIKKLTQAGGKLSPDLVNEFSSFSREKDFHFYIMYGQTEATARISYLPPDYNTKTKRKYRISHSSRRYLHY